MILLAILELVASHFQICRAASTLDWLVGKALDGCQNASGGLTFAGVRSIELEVWHDIAVKPLTAVLKRVTAALCKELKPLARWWSWLLK
jgi:hypothetical protein